MREVEYEWSGQIIEPVDGLAFIGRSPLEADNVYVVTGDSGNGLTHGTIAGMLIVDLITGKANPWAALYDPGRVRLSSGSEYLRENMNAARQYLRWVTPGNVGLADIPRGGGGVVRRGLKKLAVYKDEDGKVSAFSAVCPHLGAILSWNNVEKTWDCPAHGSRFTPGGKPLNGPANSPLKPEKL
jgi:Rieske Fe-S protein